MPAPLQIISKFTNLEMRSNLLCSMFTIIMMEVSSADRLQIPEYCLEPPDLRDCGRKPTPIFSYYNSGSRCEIEFWKGCPTLNKFSSQYECIHHCIFQSGRQSILSLAQSYHQLLEDGNENEVDGLSKEGQGGSKQTTTTGGFELPSRCQSDLNTYICTDDRNGHEIVFTYNRETGECEQTFWHQCLPADNKFISLEECSNVCLGSQVDWQNKLSDLNDKEAEDFDIAVESAENSALVEESERVKLKKDQNSANSYSDDKEKNDDTTNTNDKLVKKDQTSKDIQSAKDDQPSKDNQSSKGDQADKDDQSAKDDRPAKDDQPTKDDLPTKDDKPSKDSKPAEDDSDDKLTKDDRPANGDQPAKDDQPDKDDKPAKDDHSAKDDQPAKEDQPTKDDLPAKDNIPDKNDRPVTDEQSAKVDQPNEGNKKPDKVVENGDNGGNENKKSSSEEDVSEQQDPKYTQVNLATTMARKFYRDDKYYKSRRMERLLKFLSD